MIQNIQIETLKSGQPRPYADSEYKYKFTFTYVDRNLDWQRQNLDLVKVRTICRTLVDAIEKEDAKHGFEKIVTNFSNPEKGVYVLTATAAYTG